jgi:hypothetical protein
MHMLFYKKNLEINQLVPEIPDFLNNLLNSKIAPSGIISSLTRFKHGLLQTQQTNCQIYSKSKE